MFLKFGQVGGNVLLYPNIGYIALCFPQAIRLANGFSNAFVLWWPNSLVQMCHFLAVVWLLRWLLLFWHDWRQIQVGYYKESERWQRLWFKTEQEITKQHLKQTIKRKHDKKSFYLDMVCSQYVFWWHFHMCLQLSGLCLLCYLVSSCFVWQVWCFFFPYCMCCSWEHLRNIICPPGNSSTLWRTTKQKVCHIFLVWWLFGFVLIGFMLRCCCYLYWWCFVLFVLACLHCLWISVCFFCTFLFDSGFGVVFLSSLD